MGDAYAEFLSTKAWRDVATGIVDVPSLSPRLKEHQRLVTAWALRRGRAAAFLDTGLGKSLCIIEWSRVVAEHTGKPVLILAPLAVSHQFAREADKFGMQLNVCVSQADVRQGVNVTNYHKLHKFDVASFGGVALDESSILKSLDGATRIALIDAFRDTPFRLSATATPSPNDHTELGGQAEFLGVMKHAEMLASFFIRDGGSTQDWRLKGHARQLFWRWCASWAAFLKLPSDVGGDDTGYVLPPLKYHEHVIAASVEDAHRAGQLFALPAETLQEQRTARRATLEARVAKAAEIVNGSDARCIVWCDLNVESEALRKAIPDAVEVTGSQDDEVKEAHLAAFIDGKARVLVTKPSLAGFGLNLEFARTVVFCGVTHSFEAFYQSVRRSWRYGVAGDVNVHVISSELEGNVVANLKRKMADAEELARETRRHVAHYVAGAVRGSQRETLGYEPKKTIKWPRWLKSEVA